MTVSRDINMLLTNSEFVSLFGSEFNSDADSVFVMNGDWSASNFGATTIYSPNDKGVYVLFDRTILAGTWMRINYAVVRS